MKSKFTRALAIALPALLLAGCVQVSVLDRTASPEDQVLAAALNTREEHDVAILAVEFDPPLDALQAVTDASQVTLRVAVENKGYRKETEVQVVVRLLASQTDELLQSETQTLSSLSPGEIQVLQFRGVLSSPGGVRYRLEISADAVSGETRVLNNYKSYEIRITGRQ